MSLLTQAYLLDRFGLRLNVDQLAEALGRSSSAIYSEISAEKFAIPTYRDGKHRFADYRDVASYFDTRRSEATGALMAPAAAGSGATA